MTSENKTSGVGAGTVIYFDKKPIKYDVTTLHYIIQYSTYI